MPDLLPLLRLQAENAALLDRERERIAAVINTWGDAVLPLLARDTLRRWKNCVVAAHAALYSLDLSRARDRTALLGLVREMERIGMACAMAVGDAEAPARP